MSELKEVSKLRWAALLWGNLVLAFLLFFLMAHLFEGELSLQRFSTQKEIATFAMFPVLSVIGLAIANKWAMAGGMVTIVAMLVSYLLMPDLVGNVYTGSVLMAGILYLTSGLEKRKNKLKNETNT